jgi:hypothetical protein
LRALSEKVRQQKRGFAQRRPLGIKEHSSSTSSFFPLRFRSRLSLQCQTRTISLPHRRLNQFSCKTWKERYHPSPQAAWCLRATKIAFSVEMFVEKMLLMFNVELMINVKTQMQF